MKTKLIEFQNNKNENLRGILTLPDGEVKKAVICLHGFERAGTTEKKFKKLADQLAGKSIATLRFDFSGCGLSDGNFRLTTIDNQSKEFAQAIKLLEQETEKHEISVVAHSLGASVLATQIENLKDKLEKIILIAPALNQRDLLKYWFVTSQMKKSNPEVEINWNNYKDHLDEDVFQKDCAQGDKMTKTNNINPEYFLAAKDLDFSEKFKDMDNVLLIHGTKDPAVPLASLNVDFKNQVLVENGDHDLEKPNQFEQWIDKAVEFL